MKPYYETKLGRLWLGDCMDGMSNISKVDMILTDPPYGINMDKGFGGFGGFGEPIARKQYKGEWDSERPSKKTFEKIISIANTVLIFGGNFFADILPPSTHWIVWDKKNTMPTFGDCELIWTNIKRKSVKKYTCEYNGLLGKEGKRVHPSQKPTKLFIELIENYSNMDDIICDPFIGSGTTAIACERTGRRWVAFEKEENHCETAAKRIEAEASQLKMF